MTINPKPLADIATAKSVEGPPGIFRTTLAYVDDAMICRFRLKKDAVIPMHEHAAARSWIRTARLGSEVVMSTITEQRSVPSSTPSFPR
jgi:hypothetical protein